VIKISIVRRELPLFLATIVIFVGVFQYYIDFPIITTLASNIRTWAMIIAAVGSGIGLVNITFRYIRNIQNKTEFWYFNLYTLLIAGITAILGLMGQFATNPTYNWIINNMYMPTDATLYSMLIFDISTAFYRAFKVRNIDAGILLICASLIMLRNAPIGAAIWPPFSSIGRWLYDFPSTGGSRGVGLVTAIGTLAFAYRVAVWRERTVIGVTEGEA
jgi:hypothetical protein